MNIPTLQQLLEAGVHFGHQVRRGNPRMRPYIYGAREGVHIIDLTESEKHLKVAAEYAFQLGQEGKVLLFVGTKKQSKPIVEELAQKTTSPFLSTRWIGGFLTNFEEIKKNIKILKEIKEQQAKGELNRYTKKEQLLLDRKKYKLEQDLGGVENLEKLPDAVFLFDASKEEGAVKEASKMGVKIIAIADSNCDPTLVDYPIPGNDDAIKSIKILAEVIAEAYLEGAAKASKAAVKKAEDDEKQAEKDRLAEASTDELVAAVAEDVAAAEEEIEKEQLEKSERKVE